MALSPTHQIPWDAYETWARQQWTLTHGPGTGDRAQYKHLAATAGYDPQRLVKQKSNGAVPLYAVRDLARGLHINPLTALTTFTPIPHPTAPPTRREWLTQITTVELHTELLRRLHHPTPPAPTTDLPAPAPWATTLLNGPHHQPPGARGQRRKHVAEQVLGIPYNTLRTKERRGTWTVPELHALCEWAGWNLHLGLAVTGWLTWQELGLDPRDRYAALRDVDGGELVDAIEAGLSTARKTLDRTQKTIATKERSR